MLLSVHLHLKKSRLGTTLQMINITCAGTLRLGCSERGGNTENTGCRQVGETKLLDHLTLPWRAVKSAKLFALPLELEEAVEDWRELLSPFKPGAAVSVGWSRGRMSPGERAARLPAPRRTVLGTLSKDAMCLHPQETASEEGVKGSSISAQLLW